MILVSRHPAIDQKVKKIVYKIRDEKVENKSVIYIQYTKNL